MGMAHPVHAPAGDAAAGACFGISVALYQDTLLVGAQNKGTTLGGLSLHTDTHGWAFQAELFEPSVVVGDGFGYDVALYRDTAVVGLRGRRPRGGCGPPTSSRALGQRGASRLSSLPPMVPPRTSSVLPWRSTATRSSQALPERARPGCLLVPAVREYLGNSAEADTARLGTGR